ncbi:MAG: 4Fe-4S binding protein [Lachnospiraceae bacterium]|nr:4Fe-4S binding protein [Lachnospiraceae bacterium]
MAKITINEALCKGCEMCVNACPKHLLELAKDRINNKGYHPATMTDMEQCIGCKSCAIMCPDVCITVER